MFQVSLRALPVEVHLVSCTGPLTTTMRSMKCVLACLQTVELKPEEKNNYKNLAAAYVRAPHPTARERNVSSRAERKDDELDLEGSLAYSLLYTVAAASYSIPVWACLLWMSLGVCGHPLPHLVPLITTWLINGKTPLGAVCPMDN